MALGFQNNWGAFGYPEPLPPEALAQQRMLQQQEVEEMGRRERLKQQMTRAQTLRGQQTQDAGPLGAIGDVISQHAGRRDATRINQRQEANEALLAKALAGQGEFALQQNQRQDAWGLADAKRARQEHLETLAQRDSAARMAAANRPGKTSTLKEPRRLWLKPEEGGSPGAWTEGVWSPEHQGYVDTTTNSLLPADRVVKHGSMELTEKRSKELANAPTLLRQINAYDNTSLDEWKDISKINGIPTHIVQKFFQTGDSSGMYEWLKDQEGGRIKGIVRGALGPTARALGVDLKSPEEIRRLGHDVQRQIDWYSNFRMHFYMPYREAVTTGVLSNQDVNEFERAINVNPGMDANSLRNSVLRLSDGLKDNARETYNMYLNQGDADVYGAAVAAYEPFFGQGGPFADSDPGVEKRDRVAETAAMEEDELPPYEAPPPSKEQEIAAAKAVLAHPKATPTQKRRAQEFLDANIR